MPGKGRKFQKMKTIFCSPSLSVDTLGKESVLLYGSESWSLTKATMRALEAMKSDSYEEC